VSPAKHDDAVAREYARLAARYDHRWSFYVEATVAETLKRLEARPGDKVLDAGCGTGALLHALSSKQPKLELAGLDLSPEMLDVARARLGDSVELRQGSMEAMPFADLSFDLVVSTSVFHYVRRPGEALADALRVLTPGGRILITDWCDDYLACRLLDPLLRLFNRAHFRTYGGDQCAALLKVAGFGSVEVERYKVSMAWGMMTARGAKRG
jgi:ubiquinone/menaquinone biosynthesis C-methylase UbiE